MYSIGEVAEMFNMPISTLRYYDREGLFPFLERESGIRRFSERELESLHVIECLKLSGLEIKDIKKFMVWCSEGKTTYAKRLELFKRQKLKAEEELERMSQMLDMLSFKIWYYETAIADGSEERVSSLLPGNLPESIQKLYDHGHGKAPS